MGNELDKEQMLTLHSEYVGDVQVQLEIQQYMNNGCIYIGLNCMEDGDLEPYGDLTVNLEGKVPHYCGYLDVNNMPGIEKFVTDNGIGEFTGLTKRSGFCEFPLYMFDPDKLKELCPDGVNAYEDNIGVKKAPEVKEKAR